MTANGLSREEFSHAAEIAACLWIVAVLLSVFELAWWMCNRLVAP